MGARLTAFTTRSLQTAKNKVHNNKYEVIVAEKSDACSYLVLFSFQASMRVTHLCSPSVRRGHVTGQLWVNSSDPVTSELKHLLVGLRPSTILDSTDGKAAG